VHMLLDALNGPDVATKHSDGGREITAFIGAGDGIITAVKERLEILRGRKAQEGEALQVRGRERSVIAVGLLVCRLGKGPRYLDAAR
jgi:hypothetical protein